MCKFRENKFQDFFEKWTFINVQFYIFIVFYKIFKIMFKKNTFTPLRDEILFVADENPYLNFLFFINLQQKIFRGFLIYPIMVYNGYTNFTPKTPKFYLYKLSFHIV